MNDLDYEGFWNETMIQLQNDLGEEEFSGWFSELKYLRTRFDEKTGGSTIIIGIPSNFHREKVKSRYQNAINSNLKQLVGKEISVEYEITVKTAKKEDSKPQTPKIKEEAAPVIYEEIQIIKKKREKHPGLGEEHTFDRFIIGENNNFAANAAIAISRNPGKAYNPFLIFGGVGLGKTHLMQAIGNYVHENSENQVIYTTSENFLNEYVQAIQDAKMNLFKNKFRYTDVLLIDDIQFFQSKERIEEELFHTFNALLDSKKQLVFTSDRPVSELKKLNERLRSRFELCLKVDLQPPRYEERYAILRALVEEKNAEISNEVIEFVAKNISSNVRDLIGAINTLIGYKELMKKPVTVEIAEKHLKNTLYGPRQANLSIDNIIRVVSDYYSITPNALKAKKRARNVLIPRQIAIYISREMTEYSTTELGNEFGGRDHTTIMHSIDKIKAQLLTDPILESTINILKQNVKEFSAKY